MKRNIPNRNIQVKPDSGISVDNYQPPKGISTKENLTDLIIEMKEAIEWYMDNCTTIEKGRSYDETFYNLGMNLRMRAEEIL